MKKTKSLLQKSSIVIAGLCFIASLASAVYLTLNLGSLGGWRNPVSASFLASSFFFAFVGVVLTIIGTTNIPSFKVNDHSN